MDSSRVLSVGGAALLVVGALAFLTYRSSAEEIHRVQLEAATLRAQRDSIRAVAELRDSLRTVLGRAADSLDQRTDSLRERVAAIEAGREAAERAVWHLRTSDETEREFRQAYPEFAPSLRMTEYQPDPEIPALRYIMLPANTAKSFIVYRLRADSLELTRDGLRQIVSLRDSVIGLKDSIITLTSLNASMFRVGYDSAFAGFERLREDYIKLAQQPRFGFNLSTVSTVAGALAVGFVVGSR